MLVLGLVFLKFSAMYVRDCESFTFHIIQVSGHVQVDQSKSGCHDVCINLYIKANFLSLQKLLATIFFEL